MEKLAGIHCSCAACVMESVQRAKSHPRFGDCRPISNVHGVVCRKERHHLSECHAFAIESRERIYAAIAVQGWPFGCGREGVWREMEQGGKAICSLPA